LLLDLLEELSPLPFVKFMELCLYHPDYGYYARGNLPGKQGDFVTAPCIHPVFGATIARQILEMWEALGCPKDFLILEAGAGQGYLALDILNYLRKRGYSFKYAIIEPFPAIRAVQEEVLQDFLDDISWYTTHKDIPFFQGVFLANELFDAFPVHLVEKREGELHEVWAHTRILRKVLRPKSFKKSLQVLSLLVRGIPDRSLLNHRRLLQGTRSKID